MLFCYNINCLTVATFCMSVVVVINKLFDTILIDTHLSAAQLFSPLYSTSDAVKFYNISFHFCI